MRPTRPAHAFNPCYKNAGMSFCNRLLNGFSRVAVLDDAMYRRLIEQPARAPVLRMVRARRKLDAKIRRNCSARVLARFDFGGGANVQ